MGAEPDESLKDAEYDELAELLASCGARPFFGVLGVLTAVATAPRLSLPSEWLPLALGAYHPDSEAQANRVVSLVLRLFNDVSTTLGEEEEGVLFPDDHDIQGVGHWCEGYLAAVRRDPLWRGDKHALSLVFPIAALAGDFPRDELRGTDGKPMEDVDAWLAEQRRHVPTYAVALHDHWRTERMRAPERTQSAPTSKVNRNDPCPCGSSKKYKRCCLGRAAATPR